jgi:uncharacterized membrane protein
MMNKHAKYFITASVLLNILLLGMTLGHFLHRFRHDPFPPGVAKLLETLPEARQQEFRTMMEESHDTKTSGREEIQQTREAMAEIIKSPSFDADAYQKQADKLQVLQGKQWQRIANGIKTLALKWSPEERAVLAEMIRRPFKHSNSKNP